MVIDNYKRTIQNIEDICAKAGIDSSNITTLPISKYADIKDILTLIDYGLISFGESRLQESEKKLLEINQLGIDNIEFQFIGRLQSNKIKKIIQTFSLIQSVDSIKHLEEIDNVSVSLNRKTDILIQLNLANELQKTGFNETNLENAIHYISTSKHLILKGFMLVTPYEENIYKNEQYFVKARSIFDIYRKTFSSIDTLSMGMSNDYELAILSGTTMLRLGSVIFS